MYLMYGVSVCVYNIHVHTCTYIYLMYGVSVYNMHVHGVIDNGNSKDYR